MREWGVARCGAARERQYNHHPPRARAQQRAPRTTSLISHAALTLFFLQQISGARPAFAPPRVVRIAPKALPDVEVPIYIKPGRFAPEVVIGQKVMPAVPLVTLPQITTYTLLRPVREVPISGAPFSDAPISGAPISGGPRKMLKKKKGKKAAPPAPVSGVGPYEAYEQVLG